MAETALDRVFRKIEFCWTGSDAWPDFIQVMRRALLPEPAKFAEPRKKSSRWALLPGLCCQAAGGDPLWADDIAAAWLLFYLAAHLMDHVEDQDTPDPWWAALGPGAAINAASGLFFTASLLLNNLHRQNETRLAAADVIQKFHNSFLAMCSGQHADLVHPQPTLEQYWEVAAAKSGAFFSLACFSGARLMTADQERLEEYSQFGQYLGSLIQILDDLEEIRTLPMDGLPDPNFGSMRSLPVVFALEVTPPPIRARLLECLQKSSGCPQAAREALDLIEQSGATLYLLTEIERYRRQAQDALERANPQPAAKEMLTALLQSLDPH